MLIIIYHFKFIIHPKIIITKFKSWSFAYHVRSLVGPKIDVDILLSRSTSKSFHKLRVNQIYIRNLNINLSEDGD